MIPIPDNYDPNQNPLQRFISQLADPRNEAAANPQAFPQATIPGVLNNAVTGAGNFIKGLLDIPGQVLQGVTHPSQGIEMLKNTVKGVGSNANELLGEPVKVENGNITGVQAPSLLHAAQKVYNDPTNAALMLEGAKSLAKGKSGLKTAEETKLPPKPNILTKTGENLKGEITNVRVKPSIYGAADEAAITKTLQNDVPGTTAAEKYANLQPTMGKFSDQIRAELDANPKTVPIQNIKDAYLSNVKDLLRSKDITPAQATAEINDYLVNLYKDRNPVKPGEISQPENINPTQISTRDLFDMKTQANSDFQRAIVKERNGQPLSIVEKIQLAGRKTLDDVITKEHPLVKELTLKQSNLYDAAPSLSAARDINHGGKFLGTDIPSGIMAGGKNLLGGALTKVGGAIDGIPPIASGIGGVLPAVISSEQNSQNKPNNENPTNGIDNGNIVTPSQFQDQSGNFVLPTSETAGSTFMSDATRRQLESNLTPGTPEYTKIEQQFANEQLMAKNAMPAETMDLMTKAPIIFKFANVLNKELVDPNLTNFMNGIAKGKFKNFQAYMDSTGQFVQGLADMDNINTAYTAAMAASSAKLGQALPGPDQLITPGDSPVQAKAKLSRMMDNIGSIYNQYKDPFLALSSPSGTLNTKTAQPIGAAAIPQGAVEQPAANMKMDLSHLLPLGGQAPGLNGLPSLGQ